jgi:hypothetical protein
MKAAITGIFMVSIITLGCLLGFLLSYRVEELVSMQNVPIEMPDGTFYKMTENEMLRWGLFLEEILREHDLKSIYISFSKKDVVAKVFARGKKSFHAVPLSVSGSNGDIIGMAINATKMSLASL